MTNRYRNFLVVILAAAFATFAFVGENADAQTKNSAKKSPTPAKNATPKSSPKTARADSKPTPKPSPKSSPSKSSSSKSSSSKSSTAKNVNVNIATKPKPVQKKQLIVNVTSARIRKKNNLQSETLQYADLGTVFSVSDDDKEWSRIEVAKDKEGWISKTITESFAATNRIKTYNSIADKYIAKKNLDFKTAAEVFYFLKKTGDETENAELEFKKFKMLDAVLRLIPIEKINESQYKTFTDKNGSEIVYSEPSGEWYVKSDLLWELHARNKNKPIGEEIAWSAAQTTLPGECEGYINCYVYKMRITDGEYLNFYPGGKHSREALLNITNFLEPINQDSEQKSVYTGPSDISDRAEFNKNLAELRTIISKTAYVEKQKTIAQINRIADAFR